MLQQGNRELDITLLALIFTTTGRRDIFCWFRMKNGGSRLPVLVEVWWLTRKGSLSMWLEALTGLTANYLSVLSVSWTVGGSNSTENLFSEPRKKHLAINGWIIMLSKTQHAYWFLKASHSPANSQKHLIINVKSCWAWEGRQKTLVFLILGGRSSTQQEWGT